VSTQRSPTQPAARHVRILSMTHLPLLPYHPLHQDADRVKASPGMLQHPLSRRERPILSVAETIIRDGEVGLGPGLESMPDRCV
jgi:hypothetical protein